MGVLQKFLEIPVEIADSGQVARVGGEGFLRGALAQAALLQLPEEVFAQAVNGAAQLAADGGFMDGEGAGDLEHGALVQIVGGEQKAIFRTLLGEAMLDGRGEEG